MYPPSSGLCEWALFRLICWNRKGQHFQFDPVHGVDKGAEKVIVPQFVHTAIKLLIALTNHYWITASGSSLIISSFLHVVNKSNIFIGILHSLFCLIK